MREAWTDERLDDLNQRVSEGFADVRAELRSEIGSMRSELNERMAEMNERLAELNERVNRLDRTLMHCFLGLGTMTLTGFIGILVQSAGS